MTIAIKFVFKHVADLEERENLSIILQILIISLLDGSDN